MMDALSLDAINAKTPYRVELDENTCYSMVTTCIPDEEGINNFAALIVRLDNPHLVEIVNEFTLTAKILREK